HAGETGGSGNTREGLATAAKLFVPQIGLHFVEEHQTLRLLDREDAQNDAIDKREDGSVRPDPESQRENSDRADARIACQYSQAVAKVLKQGFEPDKRACLSHLFANRRCIAKRTRCLVPLIFDLFLNFLFQTLASDGIQQPAKHPCASHANFRNVFTAAVCASQLCISCASRFAPFFVS